MRIWQPTGKHQRLKGNKSWGSCCCGRLAMAKCITFQRQLDAFFHGPLFFCALTVFAWSHGFSFWIAREYLRRWHPDKNPVRSQVNKKLVVGIAPPEFIQHSKDESKETATAVIQFLYANKDRDFFHGLNTPSGRENCQLARKSTPSAWIGSISRAADTWEPLRMARFSDPHFCHGSKSLQIFRTWCFYSLKWWLCTTRSPSTEVTPLLKWSLASDWHSVWKWPSMGEPASGDLGHIKQNSLLTQVLHTFSAG